MLPNVEDRTPTLDHRHVVKEALSLLHRLFSTSIVYTAPTSHQWGRLLHTCFSKRKIYQQTRRPFIVFSFSTTFPCLLVNQSFIPGAGAPLHLPICTQIWDSILHLDCVLTYIVLYYVTWILYFASWGVITFSAFIMPIIVLSLCTWHTYFSPNGASPHLCVFTSHDLYMY